VIVFRSLTKSWRIPGLRLGFLATVNPAWLQRLRAMQPPWTLNSITVAWAREHLTRGAHQRMLAGLQALPEIRAEFQEILSHVSEIRVHPSTTNFFLIELKTQRWSASAVFDALAERGFLVRVCDSFHGIERGRFLRLAVRTREENTLLAAALAEVFAG
jgi:threonine-phosphate decarboxylase